MTYTCLNKDLKLQKESECPLGCGERMPLRLVLQHVSYDCPRRNVECTLNCGNTVPLDRLPSKC